MGSDFHSEQGRLLIGVAEDFDLKHTEVRAVSARLSSSHGKTSDVQLEDSVDVCNPDTINFSTLSLVETIENNFLRREHSGIIGQRNDDMGSKASKQTAVQTLQSTVDNSEPSAEIKQRPPSVEICADPGLEEAEGISHAQLLTKINSTFDNGCTAESNESLAESVGFASILDEYKSTSKSIRGKLQKSSREQTTNSSPSAKLNLTLTGMKAKQVDRFSESGTTPRGPAPRDRPQRQRNPNVMKSLEDRLQTAQKNSAKKRPEWNQNHTTSHEKQSSNKSGKSRKAPRKVNILQAIKPSNVEEEKRKFFESEFTVNPVFEYRYPANESALSRYNKASSLYLEEATAILQRVLRRYGNYEKFEAATGGRLLTRTEIWNTVKRYLEREGFFGDVVVDISNDLLSRAAMTINGGRPTLSIRESSAREFWVEGLLRHEIGTHHLRFHNNRQQTWHNASVRRQLELQPANPTEEGLASLHSVLMRKDPSLWRAAMLYYSAYKAAKLSFVELFKDLGQFTQSPEVRWDYCLRTKRGQVDTSKPGCFCKDQVYLTGILALLQRRKTMDFHMLCILGKVSYEDIDKLRDKCTTEGTKIPTFMKDIDEYRRRLDYIVHMNGLERFLDPGSKVNTEND